MPTSAQLNTGGRALEGHAHPSQSTGTGGGHLLALHTSQCCGPDFTAAKGSLLLNGRRLHVKGVSWFGFEGDNAILDGLWQYPIESYLDFLEKNQFNALRLPLALNNILSNPVPSSSMLTAEPALMGKTSLHMLEHVVGLAGRRGILVMLDIHRLNSSLWPDPQGLWYNNQMTLDTLEGAWVHLARRFCRHWNTFAADIFNEVGARHEIH